MPQYRARKTFKNKKLGPPPDYLVRAGIVLTMTDKDAAALNRNSVQLVEPYHGPSRRQAHDAPPDTKGGLRTDGPTLEEFVGAGYLAENYPPQGYAEKPSPALDELRKSREEADRVAGRDQDPPVKDRPQGNDSTPSVKVEDRRGGGAVRRSSAQPAGRASSKKT